jgi:hypothetical protein
MSGWIVGAGIPFLGPLVVAWLVMIAGVMGSYYFLMFRAHRSKGGEYVPDWSRSSSAGSAPTGGPLAPAWIESSRAMPPASPQPALDLPAFSLPAHSLPDYDMENFPDERWGTAQAS